MTLGPTPADPLPATHPLAWGHFLPAPQRCGYAGRRARQGLVLWLARLHGLVAGPAGFAFADVRLMDLRALVRDYRPALDAFFHVVDLGFFVDDEHTRITRVAPRHLPPSLAAAVAALAAEPAPFDPGPEPADSPAVSTVTPRPDLDLEALLARCRAEGHAVLAPAVRWLAARPETRFHFRPAGKLLARDTSVWPVPAVETWPGWLRRGLFGPGVDLDSAYVQFLVEAARLEPGELQDLYPDLHRLVADKAGLRAELAGLLGVDAGDKVGLGMVKDVLMGLANGARVTGALLEAGGGFSAAARAAVQGAGSGADLAAAGARLQAIGAQFASARRRACVRSLGLAPTAANLKGVFRGYFEWEREARYALWEAVGRRGLMVHDGLDGLPLEVAAAAPELGRRLGRLVTGSGLGQ